MSNTKILTALFSVLVLAVGLSLSLSSPAEAGGNWKTYSGCLKCQFEHLTGVDEECVGVGEGQSGFTTCSEGISAITEGMCREGTDPCVRGGASGGLSSGGSGGECTVSMTSVCPAQCPSCNRVFF